MDIDFQKNSWTMNFKKFQEDDFNKCMEVCIDFFRDFVLFFDFLPKSWENPRRVEKHLFFLFKVYYSPMVLNWTERINIRINKN
jgi:hypothetical protein